MDYEDIKPTKSKFKKGNKKMNKPTIIEDVKPVRKTAKKATIPVGSWIKALCSWVDVNVLPIVALIVVSGLAVRGLQVYLPAMSENAQLALSIGAVAFLVAKLKSQE